MPVFTSAGVPVHVGIQWPTREDARTCPRADIRLRYCSTCSFLFNRAFEPERLEYSLGYQNPLDVSPRFREYSRSAAEGLIERHDVHKKDVIEIGCGNGDFLALLCERGENRGVGFDPSYDGAGTGAHGFTVIKDFYSERYAHYQADLVCARHVFEHIADPVAFLSMIRRTIGSRLEAVVFMEVPDVGFMLGQSAVWDIIYEHCSYFCPRSLDRVFTRCGFQVVRIESEYEGQFLTVEAKPRPAGVSTRSSSYAGDAIDDGVASLADMASESLGRWRTDLDSFVREGRRIVLWGGGAKAISFLNMLDIQEQIKYVVDINPRKQGSHIAGTGQEIVEPERLLQYRPDVVLLSNPIYRDEIRAALVKMGVTATIMDTWAPGVLEPEPR